MNFVIVGAVFALFSIALGAFGAHALKSRVSKEMLGVYEKGVRYEMYHSLALIFVGILLRVGVNSQTIYVAGWLFAIGIVCFSGSLYFLSISGKKSIGVITPLGGLCFLAGWVLIVIGAA